MNPFSKPFLIAAAVLAFAGCQNSSSSPSSRESVDAKPLLGLQTYTFRSFTFAETLQKAGRLGIRYLQAYPGQNLGGGLPGKFHHTMDAGTRAKVLAMLEKENVKLISYGVVNGSSMDDWRQIFSFAKAMGMDSIAISAPAETLAQIDPISRELGIAISLHNHPTPARYAKVETALEAVRPFGSNVGLCADTGHWVRSGFDPVENLRRAAGRIVSLHLTDLNEVNVKKAHDVPWGTGATNMAGQLAELRWQRFGGVVFIENETNNADLERNVGLSVEFFNRAMATPLDKLLSGHVVPPGYTRTPEQLWSQGRGKKSPRWPDTEIPLQPVAP
jgi:sugar phosphate isomerase/epimerase